MTFWEELGSNQVLVSSIVGWTVAQVLKTIIDLSLNKSFSAERLVGSGGMPSSHSATVCALTTSAGLVYGVGSFQFAICFVLASVVMYDAMGVRREAGKQAKLLNLILEQDFFKLDNEAFQQRLKELIGHTPLQVLAGAILGVIVAVVMDGRYA
ncbi:divergent PAP2 family protein [Clostridium sp. AM58-1XD]|uniref:divergent PAP2 family protein n=1 Tax=Clostridium sp. AM58-1XD TaxID=2292307 RepID=UPI000E4B56CA|nr:divergent PAP2 family protein [Clostridium sp. AM58-1XD]RGZ00910.1 divergent PAP2 family protein [Clostridium sp. AM58-1XD]